MHAAFRLSPRKLERRIPLGMRPVFNLHQRFYQMGFPRVGSLSSVRIRPVGFPRVGPLSSVRIRPVGFSRVGPLSSDQFYQMGFFL